MEICCLDNNGVQGKHLFEAPNQGWGYFFERDGPPEDLRHGGNRAIMDAAGNDGGKERQVRVDIQSETMRGDPTR